VSETPSPSSSPSSPASPASRWRRQLGAVVRLELKKTFPLRTLLWLLLLALMPVGLFVLRTIGLLINRQPVETGEAMRDMAALFQAFSLRIVIPLACAVMFGSLIRREQLDRSLHFYLLTPLRRELLAAGKYLAALIVAVTLLGASTVACFVLSFAPFSSGAFGRYLASGPGLRHLGAYLLVTVLACVAYGAVFLACGVIWKGPVIPTLVVLGWELIHAWLPHTLQWVSALHYLQPLCPVPISAGLFAMLSSAPSPWLAVPLLLALATASLALAARRTRRLRIRYEED
jgi:ABC-type Na+ efflux pump permease subunit